MTEIGNTIQRHKARLGLALGKINSLSPLAVMKRGFSVCRNEKGTIIKNSKDVSRGDVLSVTLFSGELDCRVEDTRQTK